MAKSRLIHQPGGQEQPSGRGSQMKKKSEDIIFICFCGCCFVERVRDEFGTCFRVYLAGVVVGSMAMQTGACNTAQWDGCE